MAKRTRKYPLLYTDHNSLVYDMPYNDDLCNVGSYHFYPFISSSPSFPGEIMFYVSITKGHKL